MPTVTPKETASRPAATTRNPVTLLAAIDFTDLADLALDHALSIAAGVRASPHVVTVAHEAGRELRFDAHDKPRLMAADEAMAYMTAHVRGRVEALQRRQPESDPGTVLCHIRLGEPAHEIAQLAADLEADMLVIGTHGRSGVKRLLLGSVAEKTVRLAPCPVFVVRPKESPEALAQVPEIEPPCPRCVEERRATGGREMWCEQHRHGMGRRHTYSYVSRNAEARVNEPLVYPMESVSAKRY